MSILKKFYNLTKHNKGTSSRGNRGVASDFMTTLCDLLNHIRHTRDDIEVRLADKDLATEGLQYLKTCTVNC